MTSDLSFKTLRITNQSRCRRWHDPESWSLSDWGVAMGGEAGEALNVIKKINRAAQGIAGNTGAVDEVAPLMDALGEELADVVLYIDLLAARAGIDLEDAIRTKFNKTSVVQGFPETL